MEKVQGEGWAALACRFGETLKTSRANVPRKLYQELHRLGALLVAYHQLPPSKANQLATKPRKFRVAEAVHQAWQLVMEDSDTLCTLQNAVAHDVSVKAPRDLIVLILCDLLRHMRMVAAAIRIEANLCTVSDMSALEITVEAIEVRDCRKAAERRDCSHASRMLDIQGDVCSCHTLGLLQSRDLACHYRLADGRRARLDYGETNFNPYRCVLRLPVDSGRLIPTDAMK